MFSPLVVILFTAGLAMIVPLSVAIIRESLAGAIASLIMCACFCMGAATAIYLDAASALYR